MPAIEKLRLISPSNLHRLGLSSCLGQVGDAAELGQHAGGINHRLAGARDDRSPGKHQVGPFQFGHILAQRGILVPGAGSVSPVRVELLVRSP